MDEVASAWACVGASVLMIALYEAWFHRRARRHPLRVARAAHGRIRALWVRSLMREPGQELLAVQTIRNSVMSASVTASTAVLALMGALSLMGGRLPRDVDLAAVAGPRVALAALLLVILFATFVWSATAVRFFNHAGYLMGSRAGGSDRPVLVELAVSYVVRAGNYYSQGLRTLLWLMPVVAGLVSPWLMPGAVLLLLMVLRWFDRGPDRHEALIDVVSEVKE